MQISDDLGKFVALIGAAAATSDMAAIPQTQATPGDGSASIALGFPPETFVARSSGGEPPRGADMNGFLNRLSRAIQVLQAGYLGPFNAAFAAGIGGYPAGAIVSGSATGTFWVSTANNNVTVPGDSGAQWQSLFNGLATQASLTAEITRAQGVESGLSSAVSTEVSTRAAAITALQSSKQDALGFTPVQQGGGGGQSSSKIYLGWSSSNKPKMQVDTTDLGNLALENWVSGNYATQSALSAEANARSTTDTNLQNQVSNVRGSQGWVYYGASTTITVPSWATAFLYEVQAGGGGGGNCWYSSGASVSGSNASGGGGGGGGCVIGAITGLASGTSVVLTVGAGGGSQADGGISAIAINGNTYAWAIGGGAGLWPSTAAGAGGIGGAGSGGSIVVNGSDGSDGQYLNQLGFGNGGSSRWGGGGRAAALGGAGGHNFGGGGGGAYDPAGSGITRNGGGGASGMIAIRMIP